MLAHRNAAIAYLDQAAANGDTKTATALKDIVREWDRLLAQYGIEPALRET